MVHNEVCQQDDSNVTPEKQNKWIQLHNTNTCLTNKIFWYEIRTLQSIFLNNLCSVWIVSIQKNSARIFSNLCHTFVSHGVIQQLWGFEGGVWLPVERYSRGIGLWQVIHQRRPAAPCRRKGEGLWPVVIHHLQSPVSIKRHGVTCPREKITRDDATFLITVQWTVGWYSAKNVSPYSSPLHRNLRSCYCSEIPDGGAGGSGYCSDHCRYPDGCNCSTQSTHTCVKRFCQNIYFLPISNNRQLQCGSLPL